MRFMPSALADCHCEVWLGSHIVETLRVQLPMVDRRYYLVSDTLVPWLLQSNCFIMRKDLGTHEEWSEEQVCVLHSSWRDRVGDLTVSVLTSKAQWPGFSSQH